MYRIIKKRCIACGQCIESCQQHAIYMVDEEICINHAKCNDCGLCIQACPQGAIINRISPLMEKDREEIPNLNINNIRLPEYNRRSTQL